MSNYKHIRVDGTTIAITAILNGRIRYPVVVYRLTDLETPIAADDANLSSQKERTRFVEQLPPESHAEAGDILLRLSADVLAARLEQDKHPTAARAGPVLNEPWPDPSWETSCSMS